MKRLVVVITAVLACKSEAPPPAPAPVPVVVSPPVAVAIDAPLADAAIPADADENAALLAELERPPTAHEKHQDEIVEALNTLIKSFGLANAMATASDEDLMILTPPGQCDRKVLANLRKGLAALDLDPKKGFATMQCNGGPLLKLRK